MTLTDPSTELTIGAIILLYLLVIFILTTFGKVTVGDILLAAAATIITIVAIQSIKS